MERWRGPAIAKNIYNEKGRGFDLFGFIAKLYYNNL